MSEEKELVTKIDEESNSEFDESKAYHLFEPAKPGEEPPKDIWIPNRKERRLMKKRGARAAAKMYDDSIAAARSHLNQPDYKNEIYKALYERVLQRKEEALKELEKIDGDAVIEGN